MSHLKVPDVSEEDLVPEHRGHVPVQLDVEFLEESLVVPLRLEEVVREVEEYPPCEGGRGPQVPEVIPVERPVAVQRGPVVVNLVQTPL